MNDTTAKGSGLELRIEAYFKLTGYAAERNVIREGRSGAPHEIDVLASKNDGVTDVTIAIECKAWDTPIEKDVISKLSMELGDLAINKGIVVSLNGWTTGAELTAKQLGIELWGRDEIRDRLGPLPGLLPIVAPSSRRSSAMAPNSQRRRRWLPAAHRNRKCGGTGGGAPAPSTVRRRWRPFQRTEQPGGLR